MTSIVKPPSRGTSGHHAVVHLLPMQQGGVAAFAGSLAAELERTAGLASHFLSAGQGANSDRPRVSAFARFPGKLEATLEELCTQRLLVHYSNYGFAKRGCPTWLISGLEKWRGANPSARLVVIFHEVYATGLPWQSSFWLSPFQRNLARRLRTLADAVVTSIPSYVGMLERWSGRSVREMPVFSTVGEPSATPPLSQRAPRIVVFGSPGLRGRAYGAARDALRRACAVLGAAEILDIGEGSVAPSNLADLPVRTLGRLPDDQVGDILRNSLAGFLVYPGALLGKSTVFASLCAHGALPITWWSDRQPHLAPTWCPDWARPADWQQLADEAFEWYQAHRLNSHARLYAAMLA